jgi:HEAT repeat protein
LGYTPAVKGIQKFTAENSSNAERLAATIALGNIGDKSIIPILQKLLDDEEPNIRWDAAIALAKLEDSSGVQVIVNLLDRSYFEHFTEVDEEEEVQAILVAIQVASQFPSNLFVTNLLNLAAFDKNMQIRDLAIKTLDKTYNRKI